MRLGFTVFFKEKPPKGNYSNPSEGNKLYIKIKNESCATLTGRSRITAGISQKNLYTLHNFTP